MDEEIVEGAAGSGAGGIAAVAGQSATFATAENGVPPDASNDANAGGEDEDEAGGAMSLEELIYGASSFHAVVKPGAKNRRGALFVPVLISDLASSFVATRHVAAIAALSRATQSA